MFDLRFKFQAVIILFIAFVASTSPVAGDSYAFKAGANISQFKSTESKANSYLIVGISRDWRLFKTVSLSLEFLCSQKGGFLGEKKVGAGPEWQFYLIQEIDVNVSYLEIPLLLIHGSLKFFEIIKI